MSVASLCIHAGVSMLAECPNITLEALNGTVCRQNGEILITEPSPVTFVCTYEAAQRQTTYIWSLDGTRLSGLTSNLVHISIPSGSHDVTCEANIDASDNGTNNCTCDDSASLNVTVVGTYSEPRHAASCSVFRDIRLVYCQFSYDMLQ